MAPVAARADGLASAAAPDGLRLGVGPVAALVSGPDQLDGGYGAELAVARIRDAGALTATGLAVGGLDYARRDGGRVWVDVLVGRRLGPGIAGLAAGLAADLDRVRPPRVGPQLTVWYHLGLTPFVRAGRHPEGAYVEVGVKLYLPILHIR